MWSVTNRVWHKGHQKCLQLSLAELIIHDARTKRTTVVGSIRMTSLDVAARSSKELKDTPVPPNKMQILFTTRTTQKLLYGVKVHVTQAVIVDSNDETFGYWVRRL